MNNSLEYPKHFNCSGCGKKIMVENEDNCIVHKCNNTRKALYSLIH